MKRHKVTMTRITTKVQNLTAGQLAAVGPGWTIVDVDGNTCIGRCESCRCAILEGSPHSSYSDGVLICDPCEQGNPYDDLSN